MVLPRPTIERIVVGRPSESVVVIFATVGAARVERLVNGFPRESVVRMVDTGFPDALTDVSSATVGGDDDPAGTKAGDQLS